MGVFRSFRRGLRSLFGKSPRLNLPEDGEFPSSRDTLSVIHDLSQVVRNNPEAVDIYMALGNLFRAQGDIERAVLIRERLMARPGLDSSFKARASFELGQDYRRAGVVDRALAAYTESIRLGYAPEAVTAELAGLYAESGSFEKAAQEYGKLGRFLAEAHYLVLAAEDAAASGQDAPAAKLLKKAMRTYPGSVEAWCASISMAALAEEWRKTASQLKQALGRVASPLHFLLLDALHQAGRHMRGPAESEAPPEAREPSLLDIPDQDHDIPDTYTQAQSLLEQPADGEKKPAYPVSAPPAHKGFAASLCDAVIPVLEKQEPGVLLHYYGALLLKEKGDTENAILWLSKALVMQPNFWAARMELLNLAAKNHELPAVLALQVNSLSDQLHHIKRFICAACGLRQNAVFYRCPRCGRWHTVSFRLSLQE